MIAQSFAYVINGPLVPFDRQYYTEIDLSVIHERDLLADL